MAKTIPFNIKLTIDGKEVVVKCKRDVEQLAGALTGAKSKTDKLKDAFATLSNVGNVFRNAYGALNNLTGVMDTYIQKANAAAEAQTKLTTVMRQRMDATDADVAAVNAAVKAQTELGVVGGTVQRQGLQQLATFAAQKQTLIALLPAMNNLLTQQKGLNATSEDAVGIANLLGKALMGQTSALKRVGITFSDAQAEAIKAGDEGTRAAMIAEIITQNVGNMNAELAKTDAGRVKQLANEFGGVLTNIGKQLAPFQEYIALFGQIGMAVTGVVQFGTALWGVGAAAVAGAGKLAALITGTTTWKVVAAGATAITNVLTASMTGAAVGATTLRTALIALDVCTVVGAALAALSLIVYGIVKSFDSASDSADAYAVSQQTAKEASEGLKQKLEDENKTVANHKAQLTQDIATLKNWHGTKTQEKKIVEELNGRYGETLGYFSSVSDWYQALIADSKDYCLQLEIEAQMRALANQKAENDQKIHDIRYNADGTLRRYDKTQQKSWKDTSKGWLDTWADSFLAGNGMASPFRKEVTVKGTSPLEVANAKLYTLYGENHSIDARMDKLAQQSANITYRRRGRDTNAPVGGVTPKATPKHTPKATGGGTGGNTPGKEPAITDGIHSLEELDARAMQLWEDFQKLDSTDVAKGLDIQDKLEQLAKYREEMIELQDMQDLASGRKGAEMLSTGMIGGNVAGNTGSVDFLWDVQWRQMLEDAKNHQKYLTEHPLSSYKQDVPSLPVYLSLQNQKADDIRQQIETVLNAVDAGEIGEDMGKAVVAGLNKKLMGMGKKPMKQMSKTISHLTDGMKMFGEVASAAGNAFGSSTANVAGIIAEGIANIVLAFADAMKSDKTTKSNIWTWIAASAAATAQLLGIIAGVRGATGYATGGIVGGSSWTGDRVPARVNSGEMILTRVQQRRLWELANGVNVQRVEAVRPRLNTGRLQLEPLRVEVSGRLSGNGRQLVAVIGNEKKARGSAGWKLPF